MSADHARFAEWDAAYVLGALSPADRRAFEEHLDACGRCVRAIAEVAATLGLLAQVEPERAVALLADAPAETGLPAAPRGRARLLERARRERRRRRATWAAGLAAAVAIAAAIAVPLSGVLDDRSARSVELAALVDAPLEASIELEPAAWGTRLELECSYEGDADPAAPEGLPYVLVLTDRAGQSSEVSSWLAAPGQTARLSAATALAPDEIASIEIRLDDGDMPIMRAELDAR
ncbi:zf-HC2 domain-containing protein [Agrococcus sp. TSP3-2-1]|uniref:zf-HC2 domain-containing protein n=1 Tax=Agrococcus sp. TSP3-2-1 TaxID=2804583 RepID=UPI003CF89855